MQINKKFRSLITILFLHVATLVISTEVCQSHTFPLALGEDDGDTHFNGIVYNHDNWVKAYGYSNSPAVTTLGAGKRAILFTYWIAE